VVRIAEGLPPDNPNGSPWGWAHAIETDRAMYDIHPGRSLAVMGVASVAATFIAWGLQESPEGIGFSWAQTYSSSVVEHSVEETGPTDEVTHKTTGHPGTAPVTTQRMQIATALMPDVGSFDLSHTPEAQHVINGEEFSEFLTEAHQLVNGGWTLSSYHVEGMSSDETDLDQAAGLGEPDSGNVKLAEQYSEFVAGVFEAQMVKAGFTATPDSGSVSSHEAVLTPDQLTSVAQIRQEKGFASNKELVEAYKSNPEQFSASDQYMLKSILDDSRGATVQMVFSRTTPGTPGTLKTTIIDHCVITRRVVDTTLTSIWHEKELIPIVVVPFIWPRRQRKLDETGDDPELEPDATDPNVARNFRLIYGENSELDEVIADDPTGQLYRLPFSLSPGEGSETVEPAAVPEVPETVSYITSDASEILDWYGIRAGRDGRIRFNKRGLRRIQRDLDAVDYDQSEYSTRRLRRLSDRLGYDGDVGSLERLVDDDSLRRDRMQRRRRFGLGLAGGILALAASTIRLDAGYCPDPQNYAHQSFRWNDFPDSIHAKFHLWFTNIDSPEYEILPAICDTRVAVPRIGNPKNPEPSCDVRTIHVENGQVVSTIQTHYPGATTVTTERP
jgi:hypothetical protein